MNDWKSQYPQLRNWHVEIRFTDDTTKQGSRWEHRSDQTESQARATYASLCAYPRLHVRLSQHHPRDAHMTRIISTHTP